VVVAYWSHNQQTKEEKNFIHSGVDGEEEMDDTLIGIRSSIERFNGSSSPKSPITCGKTLSAPSSISRKETTTASRIAKSRLQLNKSVCLLHLPMFVVTLDGNYCQFLV
jgi:hypothetical protein